MALNHLMRQGKARDMIDLINFKDEHHSPLVRALVSEACSPSMASCVFMQEHAHTICFASYKASEFANLK